MKPSVAIASRYDDLDLGEFLLMRVVGRDRSYWEASAIASIAGMGAWKGRILESYDGHLKHHNRTTAEV